MRLSGLVLALSVLTAGAIAPRACPRLKPLAGRGVFQDICTGNEVVVHGVNAVYKGAPWLPDTTSFDPRYSLAPEDAEMLQSWGLNGVRLGVMWPGAMPSRGVVDASYLNKVAEITAMLGNRSVFTLLDAHQDCLSAKFCGEGAPNWAIPTISAGESAFPAPIGPPFVLNASGVPSPEDCGKYSWSDYQLTVAGAQGYQALYQNKGSARDEFARFWGAVASALANASHVIGAELLNEPFAGDIYSDPLLLVPGVADRENLQPFHDAVAARIAAADPDLAVFVESVTWDDFVPVGFNHTPLSPPDRTGLSFHYYNLPNFDVDVQIASRLDDAKRLGMGAFLTEFNLNADATNTSIPVVIAAAENRSVSWLGWEYKPYVEITGWGWGPVNPDGSRNDALVAILSRPYPQRVCGTIMKWEFDPQSRVFSLSYSPEARRGRVGGCSGGADVYINCDLHFPGCNANATVVEGAGSMTATVEPAPAPQSPRATRWATVRVEPVQGQQLPASVTVIVRPA